MATHQPTAVITASVILKKENLFLFVKEPNGDDGYKLLLPGGHIEMGETVPDAAIREVLEETGYQAELTEILSVFTLLWSQGQQSVRFAFYGEIIGGEEKPEEGSELLWMTLDEFDKHPALKEDRLLRIIELLRNGKKIDSDCFVSYRLGKEEEVLKSV